VATMNPFMLGSRGVIKKRRARVEFAPQFFA
jgi:hypothetical protein